MNLTGGKNLMEHAPSRAELGSMIKRACIWMVIGLVAALMSRLDLSPVMIKSAQILFCLCAGLTVLSLLLSLFEEADEPEEHEPLTKTMP
jgi:uncharacterized membrane protein YtjA (UPF0391 family)